MRFGTWGVRSWYRAGSLRTEEKTLANHRNIGTKPLCRSYFMTDGRSVSQSVHLDFEPTLGLVTKYYFLSVCC
jgi:hypothetical protein